MTINLDELEQQVTNLVSRKGDNLAGDLQALVNAAPELIRMARRVEGLERELERWRHGQTIEGDHVCPYHLEVCNAREMLKRVKDVLRRVPTLKRLAQSTVGCVGCAYIDSHARDCWVPAVLALEVEIDETLECQGELTMPVEVER